MIVRWTNKCSGEQGYVKVIRHKEGYFENTFEQSQAKNYSPSRIGQVIKTLENLCGDNTYEGVNAVIEDKDKNNKGSPP